MQIDQVKTKFSVIIFLLYYRVDFGVCIYIFVIIFMQIKVINIKYNYGFVNLVDQILGSGDFL